jgi:adenylate cyclase
VTEQRDQAVRDFFLTSLQRLGDNQGSLQTTLRHMRQALSEHRISLPINLDACLREVHQDLKAVQVGSKRVIKQFEQLQGLVRTSALITSSLDLDRVLREIMDTAINLIDAERAYLVLRERDDDELKIVAARNWEQETLSEGDIVFSRGVVRDALERGEPVLTINAQGDDRFQGNESVLIHDLRSIVCIPLAVHERAIGVLYADNRSMGIFDEGSVPLLTAFGSQAAIAIENARLFKQVKADLDEAQHEVKRLRLQIEIDHKRVKEEVGEITESKYFQELSSLAHNMRRRHQKANG